MPVRVLGGERARPLTARLGLAVVLAAVIVWGPWQAPRAHAARAPHVAAVPASLGPAFATSTIGPITLYTDAEGEVRSAVVDGLIRSVREFPAWAAPLGLPLTAPEGALRVFLFARHEDFLTFARQEDGIDASWMGGYYAAGSNRVVLYDDADSPEFRALVARCPNDRSGDALRSTILLEARQATVRKAAHEVAHLLAFNTGLQRREAEYPLWLTEGLAEAFVADVFGPAPVDPGRKPAPMRELLSLGCSGGLHRNDMHGLYEQSRGLVASLRARSPQRLGACLEAFGVAPAGSSPLALAERVLGPSSRWARTDTPALAGVSAVEP